MSAKIDGFSREKYIELTARIAAGLLASGHFTNCSEDRTQGWVIWDKEEKKYLAVSEAEEVLESIIASHDALAKLMKENP